MMPAIKQPQGRDFIIKGDDIQKYKKHHGTKILKEDKVQTTPFPLILR